MKILNLAGGSYFVQSNDLMDNYEGFIYIIFENPGIVGFPGETKEQVHRTFSFTRKLRLTSTFFFIANLLPGSRLYEICKERGYPKDGFDFETINYTQSNYETSRN